MKPETLRALTLLLCAIGGFAAIYLGYDLYRQGVEGLTQASGEWNQRRFWLESGGPGLLFVVAGTTVVVSVIWRRFSKETTRSENPGPSSETDPAPKAATSGGGGSLHEKVLMDKRKDFF